MKLSYTVNQNETFDNVKELLKTKFQISDRLLLKLKQHNKILLNSKATSISNKVNINDVVDIFIDFEEDNSNIIPTKMNLDIIYEDESYIVVNKPDNTPIHPSMDHFTDSLSNGIKYYFDSISLHRKIRPVNRIDKNTSGLVVFAKNEYIQECLIKQMKSNQFQKEYIAICNGIFKDKKGIIDAPIARKENSIIERCIDINGAPSRTKYEVLDEIDGNYSYSIVKCILETGRTHQIRVHMMYIGHPLLGDTLYGNSSSLIDRQALHAYKINFIHPIFKNDVTYIASIPKDMHKLFNKKFNI